MEKNQKWKKGKEICNQTQTNSKPLNNEQGGNESKTKNLIMPLFLIFALICVVTVLLLGIQMSNNNPEGLAGIFSKEIHAEETEIGEGIKAIFNESTNEIAISGTGTINVESWKTFLSTYGKENIKIITFKNTGISAPENSSSLFENLSNLTTIKNSKYLNVSNVQVMTNMFRGCSSLTSLDLSSWKTENVTDVKNMLYGCSSLTTINLSKWKTENLKFTNKMFYGCTNLKTVNLGGWNTTNLTETHSMFFGCKNLTKVDLTGWNPTNLKFTTKMFEGCSSLTSINMSNWDMTKVREVTNMLEGCNSLTEIYTPAICGDIETNLPSDTTWYNASDVNDNKEYSSYKNGIFGESVQLKRLINYDISYELDGGQVTGNPDTYNALSNFTLKNPTKENCTFEGWTSLDSETKEKEVTISGRNLEGDLSYIANWSDTTTEPGGETGGETTEPGGDETPDVTEKVEYRVQHWQQNVGGIASKHDKENYTLMKEDTVKATAKPGEKVTAKVNDYPGFISPEEKEIIVAADGTTLKKYYYVRNSYSLTINPNGGIWEGETEKSVYSVDYGDTKTIEMPTKEGYNFTGWELTGEGSILDETTFTMGTGDATLVANWMIKSDLSYTVKYLEKGTDKELSAPKVVNDRTYGTEINVSDEVIDIEGYIYDSANKETLRLETETNEIIIYYLLLAPNITSSVTQNTEYNRDYLVAGETIKYTIIVNNSGTVGKEVLVKESIPVGTTFKVGSIQVNEEPREELTEEDLENGISINVPKLEKEIDVDETTGTVSLQNVKTISFEVTVNEDATGDIVNATTVDEEMIETAEMPIISYEKIASVTRERELEDFEENEVTVGDQIRYTIKVNNTGTIDIQNIEIKDIIPEGTKILSVENEGNRKANEITWQTGNIASGEAVQVSFVVEVKYKQEEHTISNVATIDGIETNSVDYEYKKLGILVSSSLTDINTNISNTIKSKDTKIYHEIELDAEINYFVGKAKVTIVKTLPYAIDEEQSMLSDGTYDKDAKTITWVREIDNIDTFETEEAKTIRLTKAITLKYIYENLEEAEGKIVSKTESTIELQEPQEENGEYVTVKTDNKVAENEILIQIPAQVIVHHYKYDEELKENTEIKLVSDEIIDGIIGQEYTTEKSKNIPNYYTCKNEEPEKFEGKMTEEPIHVNYYYEIITPTIEKDETLGEVKDTVVASKVDENGRAILTKEDGRLTYNIRYVEAIKDYKGKAKVEIIDKLPAAINLDKSTLAGGIYDSEEHTITWTEYISNIDTFANTNNTRSAAGTYIIDIAKEISIVFEDQDVTKDLVSRVTKKLTTYYPEDYPEKGGEVFIERQNTDEITVKQEYKVHFKAIAEWDDNENAKGKRPESVTIEIRVMPNDKAITRELNEENNWTYEETDLRKYNSTGEKITYIITEQETEEGDLEYYAGAEIEQTEEQTDEITNTTFTITNPYRLMNTDLNTEITIEGTEEIEEKDEEVEYTINLKSEITEYIGEGKVKIVDKLPYKIDVENSNIAKGIYDEEKQTITWEQELPHINTYKKTNSKSEDKVYDIDITKKISLVYEDIDLAEEKMTNTVNAKIELYETEEKDEQTGSFDTAINVQGKVIVKYVEQETGKELANQKEIVDKIGISYEVEPIEIEHYMFIEVTGNKVGTISEQSIEVIFYYNMVKTSVVVKHQDKDGNELAEEEILDGYVGDTYKAEAKQIENYRVLEIKGNAEGQMQEEQIEVIYVYEKIPAKVIVKYLEKATEDKTEGTKEKPEQEENKPEEGTEETPEQGEENKPEEGTEETPEQGEENKPEEGTEETPEQGEENKPTEEVKEKELLPTETIEGFVGDDYEITRKVVENYRAAEPEPANATGKMTEEAIEVIYYYERIPGGDLVVKYVDLDTNEVIYKAEDEKEYQYVINGYVGEKYETKQEDIPYYVLVKNTENTQGQLKEEGDTIIYYYRKLDFNMSVEKSIDNITLNGNRVRTTNNTLAKIEVKTNEIDKTDLVVSYNIKVTNKGELAGTAKVSETIPKGFEVIQTPEYWKEKDNKTLETEVELEPKETKELNITLRWVNDEKNLGSEASIAKIASTTNAANFADTNEKDNKSEATVVVSIKTGITVSIAIIVMIISSLVICGYIIFITISKIRKDSNTKNIKFLTK